MLFFAIPASCKAGNYFGLTAFSCPVLWIQSASFGGNSNFLKSTYVLRAKVDSKFIYFSQSQVLVILFYSLVRSCYCKKKFSSIFCSCIIPFLRESCSPYILTCYYQKQKIRNEPLVCPIDNTNLIICKRFFMFTRIIILFKILKYDWQLKFVCTLFLKCGFRKMYSYIIMIQVYIVKCLLWSN